MANTVNLSQIFRRLHARVTFSSAPAPAVITASASPRLRERPAKRHVANSLQRAAKIAAQHAKPHGEAPRVAPSVSCRRGMMLHSAINEALSLASVADNRTVLDTAAILI